MIITLLTAPFAVTATMPTLGDAGALALTDIVKEPLPFTVSLFIFTQPALEEIFHSALPPTSTT